MVDIPLSHRSLLRRGEALILDDAQGTVIAVERGCLWVTQEHDPRDIILGKGMRFEIDRRGRTIVAAEAPSRVRLQRPPSSRQSVAASVARLLAA